MLQETLESLKWSLVEDEVDEMCRENECSLEDILEVIADIAELRNGPPNEDMCTGRDNKVMFTFWHRVAEGLRQVKNYPEFEETFLHNTAEDD